MGVDTTSVASGRGRNSVRITSKKSYNAGSLIILDLSHMPGSVCGTWPAFWTVGPSWPNNGEIDIIEGVNTQSYNHYAVHTSSGCSISNTGMFSGSIETQDCDVNAAGQPNNAGCSIVTSDTSSYGDGFNAGRGGVYATEFTPSAISIWFFPRSAIPADITSGSPNPSGWGNPHASFGSPCNIGQIVKQQQIVFDTTFCGDWAGSVWSTDATCSAKAGTCQDFVQNNPSAFKESYWSINSLRVYSGSGSGGGQPGGSGTASQRPTISGGVPTGQPTGPPQTHTGQPPFSSAPGGSPGFPPSSIAPGAPAPAPSASQWSQPQEQPQPQEQSWADGNNNWGNGKLSAWDGGQWGQATGVANNAVAPSAAAGGQFYDASTPAASGASVNTYNAAAAIGSPGTGASTGGDETLNTYQSNAANVKNANAPADADANPVTSNDATDASNANGAAPEAQAQGEPQYEDIKTATPSPSISARPSKTLRPPWMRSSWSGRYVTVTALGNADFHNAKRDLDGFIEKVEMVQEHQRQKREEEAVSRRNVEGEEALRRRGEKQESNVKRAELNEGFQGEHLHRHRHVGVKKRGWWRS